MDLSRFAREYYELTLTTDPVSAPADWEASFDAGQTWVDATNVGGKSAWLVAGRAADDTGAVAVLRHSVTPLVRLTAAPEIVVRDAPDITVV